jgi:AcrR family transcriptional regulator
MLASGTRKATSTVSDGRVRRGERSGNAIVEALIELVGEGILDPTAQQVAERASVGIRTVFRRFSDMESLFAKVGVRLEAGALPLLLGGEPHGDVQERARRLIAQRVLFFERIAVYKRAANLKRWRSPLLSERHALLVRALRADLLRWLPELSRAPASLADALELTTSFEAWDRLRIEQRLGRERAHAAVERMVLRLAAELTAR